MKKSLIWGLFWIMASSTWALAQGMGGQGGGMRMDPNNAPKIGKVSGVVLDAESGKPIPYATVALQRSIPKSMLQRMMQGGGRPGGNQQGGNPQGGQGAPEMTPEQREQMRQRFEAMARDTSIVAGMVSDEKGQFLLQNLPLGAYKIKVSFIGYKTFVRDSLILARTYEVDLGKIRLASSERQQVITVTGERPEMEVAVDRKIFNVDKNLVASNGSAEDVMRTIPTVEVDTEGNVSMRGSQNVTILVDGRPSNLSTMLEQLPAGTIERVEIITNPSARYEAQGSAGIINIVLKKNKLVGYNGQMSAGAGLGGKYNAGASINYRQGKWNMFTNYNFRQMAFVSTSTNLRTNYSKTKAAADTTYYFDQSSDGDRRFGGNSLNAGLEYFANDLLTFTLQGGLNARNQDANSEILYQFLNQNKNSVLANTRNTITDGGNQNIDLSASMQKRFKTAGREWTIDLNYNNGDDENNNVFNQTSSSALVGGALQERNTTDNISQGYSLRTDYVHPFSNGMRMEGGARTQFRSRDTDYLAERLINNSWMKNAILSNQFIYDEAIHSAYGIFSGTAKKLAYQFGLRGEWTVADGNQVTTGQTFSKNYVNFFPSLSLRQELPNNQNINVSVSRRINRPRDQVLNPFVDFTDPLNVRVGNPNLDPEFVNVAEAGYTRYWNKFFLTTNIFYNQTNDLIGQLITTNTQGIATTSYANLNKATSTGLELVMNYRPVQMGNINLSFNYYYNQLEGTDALGKAFENDGYSWSTRAFWFLRLPADLDLQGFFNYMAPRVGGFGGMGTGSGMGGMMGGGGRGGMMFFAPATAKSTSGAVKSLDFGLKKSFLNRKLDVNFRFMDVLNSRTFTSTSEGDGFKQESYSKFDRRGFMTSITYKFGTLQDQGGSRRRRGGEEVQVEDVGM